LAAAEMELVSVMGREVVLSEALQAAGEPFDVLMIDCPPSLGVLTINGLAAVQEVLIPMQPHFLALQGVGKLLESISLIHNRINRGIRVAGIILCMYEAGTRLAGEVAADLAGFLEASRDSDKPWSNARVFDTIIRRNIKLAECPSHGQTIFEYAMRSNGAADYARLAEEVFGISAASIAAHVAEGVATTAPPEPDQTVEPVPHIEATAPAEIPHVEVVPGEMASPELEPAEPDVIESTVALAEPEPVPALDAGDRTAYGPDDVITDHADDAEQQESEVVAEESNRLADMTSEAPQPPQLTGARSIRIPVMQSDDAESHEFDFAAAPRHD
jgi:chromosome partitioning protein